MSDHDRPLVLEKDADAPAAAAAARLKLPPPPEPEPVETAPPSATAPAPATAPDDGGRRYRRRVLLALLAVVVALVLYWASGYVFAYTDDAYVTSDLVAVAPQVTGRIVAVHIVDNQTVKKGDLLAEIDPKPFRLLLDEEQAKRTEAEAQLAVDHDAIKSAKAARDAAAAKEQMARDNLARARPVAAAGFVSRQALEDATTQAQAAAAGLADAEDSVAKARQMQNLHEATIAALTARIGYLQWQLDQTRLIAPTDGTITNLTLRVGDQAVENKPMIALVDAHAWRVLANYKETVIRHMRVGGTAWVWLDANPWHLHRARIQGIARGISRQQTPGALLPYVEPTTDWIRLERRFPVTLDFVDLSPEIVLHMGSDARALIIY
jgi:multidrug efflux system membrane fusion protein